MASFEPAGDTLSVRFDSEEALLLKQLLAEIEMVLNEGPGQDAIRARLYPDAYETPEDQASYQELVGDQLRDQKLKIVRQAREQLVGEELTLDTESMQPWLVVLTDIRLAIGARLNVTEESMDRDLDPNDPDTPALSVMHWLGWVQESLLTHLT